MRDNPFGVAKKVQGKEKEEQNDDSGDSPVQRGEAQSAEREQDEQRKTFRGDGSGCGAHRYLQ